MCLFEYALSSFFKRRITSSQVFDFFNFDLSSAHACLRSECGCRFLYVPAQYGYGRATRTEETEARSCFLLVIGFFAYVFICRYLFMRTRLRIHSTQKPHLMKEMLGGYGVLHNVNMYLQSLFQWKLTLNARIGN